MQRIGILITGYPGSGSTTLGKLIASQLKWPPPYYAGGVVAWLSFLIERYGVHTVCRMSVEEIMLAMEQGNTANHPSAQSYQKFPPELDRLVDQAQKMLLEKKNYGVHEGRLTPFLAKELKKEGKASDKIFVSMCCTVDPMVGAERQCGRPGNAGKNIDQIILDTNMRLESERSRYQELYGITNHLAPEQFDIVLDTTNRTPSVLLRYVLQEITFLYPGIFDPYNIKI